jgi:hypothetical protein
MALTMVLDRLGLFPVLTVLVLSTASCGLSSDIDGLFSKDGASGGSAGSTTATGGSAAGGTGGGTTNVGGGGTTNVGGGGTTNVGGGGSTSTGGGQGGGGTGGGNPGGGGQGGATGGGGQGGGGTGGMTTTTTTTTTTSVPPENCLDGVDNDGDGAVDCADSDCTAGFQCVPAVPNGWKGYYEVSQTDFPNAPGACDGGAKPDVYFAGPAGPPECTMCTCGDLAGGTCSAPQISCWAGSSTCMGQETDWTQALADGNCHKPFMLLGFNNQLSCELKSPSQVVTKGSCAPSFSDFPNKNTWKNEVGACSVPATGGGCPGAHVCVPKPAGGAAGKICIEKAGNTQCPAGGPWNQVLTYTSGTDTRSCAACKCGDGSASCNGGLYTAYDLDQCAVNGGDPPIPIDSANCKNVSALLDQGSWSFKGTIPTPTGTCPASGGEPQGQVSPDGAVTFCCQP